MRVRGRAGLAEAHISAWAAGGVEGRAVASSRMARVEREICIYIYTDSHLTCRHVNTAFANCHGHTVHNRHVNALSKTLFTPRTTTSINTACLYRWLFQRKMIRIDG
uniref:Uncharacterized protein n=1 Tax=Setaria italica TaxID=4555 RepID=K3YKD5_SETIT